ncbi:maleylacetoacetate isomerase [Sphingobium sp. HWE2-09]|uniref:maleylacetoacetate isomerase n=1 Tax=Sphingobium sp. HWE2-09 TaxID=3108390 RepID=UPI002DC51B1D|nr:maleylacetoacetate isomerase [Sphingobium sp. HWE2-09]
MIQLYSYFRSSTSYRVRIALNLKELDYAIETVNLAAGDQVKEAFLRINPAGGVPVLQIGGRSMMQSVAIIEWLDEVYGGAPLLPQDPDKRFIVREAASMIATELHAPLNLTVLQYLKKDMSQDQASVDRWYHHWLAAKLKPLEHKLEQRATGDYLVDAPGLFECVLIPQLYNARRFAFDLESFPRMRRIETACAHHPAFIKAHPSGQPDTPEGHRS